MPLPSVTESAPGSDNYTIANSRALIANVNMDVQAFGITGFTITYPQAATGLSVTLQRTLPLPASGVVDLLTVAPGTDIGGYNITVNIAPPAGGLVLLTCSIENTGGGAFDHTWEIRAKVDAAVTWNLTMTDPGNTTRNFVASDPRAELTAPPAGGSVFENGTVTLAAANASLGTVLGTLPPELAAGYRWSHTGPIAIIDLPKDTPVNSHAVAMPGVYQAVQIQVTVQAAFGGTDANDTTGFLQAVSAPVDVTIKARPQHIVLVLDRSGSMASEGRWDSAVTAARVLTHLFAGAREGVNADDRIGIVVFEDGNCTWHVAPRSAAIETKMPLTALDKAKTDIISLNLGAPGSCTPIGDGLIAGIDLLADDGPVGDKHYTVILLTDGFENAGTIFVGAVDPSVGAGLPAGTIKPVNGPLPDAAHPLRDTVKNAARKFIIGLGATVENAVLNHLATSSGGQFASAATPSELADEFANMLQFSQEVNHLPASNVAPAGVPADPSRAYFATATGAERLVFAVLRGGLAATEASVKLDRWDPAASVFAPQAITVLTSGAHHFASVADLTSVTAGASAIWRVTSVDGANSPLSPLPAANVLAYEDLRVKAAVRLDQPEYLTGDDMILTVLLRHDGSPIPGATVRAELDAPGEGVGEVLSTLGDLKLEKRAKDHPPLPAAMIEQALRQNGWKTWPQISPTGPFVDGTDLLHDPDNDGNYTNTFDQVFKEGVYSWKLFVEGVDLSGNPFSRQLAIATVAGIRVDARATRIRQERVANHPSGMHAVLVTMTPQDVRGERLGPNKDHVVIWALQDGIFEHILNHEPAPVFSDGTYRRVVLYRSGQRPTLAVKANGTVIPRFSIHPSHPSDADPDKGVKQRG